MDALYIGIMSGTSADGIDAVLVSLPEQANNSQVSIIATVFTPFADTLRDQIQSLFTPGNNEIDRLGSLDTELGDSYLQAVSELLEKTNYKPKDIAAVGLHGQTIRHRPDIAQAFTLQIGNPYPITQLGIAVVNDFRRADMTAGGQGAPLAPLFHQAFFASADKNRVILNTGGIANISYLQKHQLSLGFDTGPANGLMDAWIKLYQGKSFDKNGDWARTGKVQPSLLAPWLDDDYYRLPPPKSTGKEYFTLRQLNLDTQSPNRSNVAAADIQRSLCELSAISITDAIKQHCQGADEIWVCGGGAYNSLLMERIAELSTLQTATTAHLGIAPDWVEAAGFAWLAKKCLERQAVDTRPVTGAKHTCILGAIHPAI